METELHKKGSRNTEKRKKSPEKGRKFVYIDDELKRGLLNRHLRKKRFVERADRGSNLLRRHILPRVEPAATDRTPAILITRFEAALVADIGCARKFLY